jgi:cytochrome P450
MTHVLSLPERVPTPRNRRFNRARAELDAFVYEMIRSRRADHGGGMDLLSLLLGAVDDETGEGFSEEQVRDEVMTIIAAGHETTANALSWAWYLLAHHPEARERLQEELAGVLGGRLPALDDLPRLEYTRMVVEETLRLYPPAWVIGRRAVEADVLGGYRVEKGATVFVSPYLTQRRADLWPEPQRFRPERFSAAASAARQRYAYFPFGGGPHLCVGNEFAMMEAQLILATVAPAYRLALVRDEEVAPEPLVTLRPPRGMEMRIEPVEQEVVGAGDGPP